MACQLGGFLEHDLALSSSQTQLRFVVRMFLFSRNVWNNSPVQTERIKPNVKVNFAGFYTVNKTKLGLYECKTRRKASLYNICIGTDQQQWFGLICLETSWGLPVMSLWKVEGSLIHKMSDVERYPKMFSDDHRCS